MPGGLNGQKGALTRYLNHEDKYGSKSPPGSARQCPAVPGSARMSAAMTPPFQAFSSRAGLQEDVRMWQAQTPSNYYYYYYYYYY